MAGLTLGEFHALVQDGIGRGSSVSSLIPLRVKMAANWLERNYLFQYMRTWRTLEVSASAEFPHIISLSQIPLRGVELIRRKQLGDDETIVFGRPLKKVKPADRESRPEGVPESYWLNGRSSIVLSSIPNEDMTFEVHLQEYTNWGSGEDWTHWLLDNATQLLLARTMMILGSTRLRDPKLWEMYKAEFDLEIQSFNVSEEETQAGDFISIWEPPDQTAIDETLRSA